MAVEEARPDAVLIAGDVFESMMAHWRRTPYETLAEAIPGVKIIFTLGNHEFIFDTIGGVIGFYEKHYRPGSFDVHCLDVVGRVDLHGVRVFGNALFYDGTIMRVKGQKLTDFADGRWLDREIRNFDPVKECAKAAEAIRANMPRPGDGIAATVLMTHCVPCAELNAHPTMGDQSDEFSAFSGVSWLLDEIRPDIAVCGHTHLPAELSRGGTRAINIGNDYSGPLLRRLIEVSMADDGD